MSQILQIDGGAPAPDGVDPLGRAAAARRRRMVRLLRSASATVAAVGLWWLVTALWLDNERLYPTPVGVWEALLDIASGETPLGSTWMHLGATLERALLAFAIGYVVGTVLGVIAGRNPKFFDFMTPSVWIAFSVPSVVWVFLFLLVFGISNLVPVMALVVLLSAPVFLGAAEGTKATNKDLIAMSDAYHVRGWRRLVSVYLPSIVPFLLANARVSFALAVRIVIIAEVVGLPDGVGLVVRYWADRLYMAPVVAWGLVLAAVGLVVDRYVIGYFERRTKRWSAGATAAS